MPGPVLGQRVLAFPITTPIGTLASAPQTTNVDLGVCTIDTVEIRIPSGHLGFTGFALEYGQQRLIPAFQPSAWIIGDNDLLDYVMNFDVGKPVQVKTYNTGNYPHTHYLRFLISDITLPSGPRSTLIQPV